MYRPGTLCHLPVRHCSFSSLTEIPGVFAHHRERRVQHGQVCRNVRRRRVSGVPVARALPCRAKATHRFRFSFSSTVFCPWLLCGLDSCGLWFSLIDICLLRETRACPVLSPHGDITSLFSSADLMDSVRRPNTDHIESLFLTTGVHATSMQHAGVCAVCYGARRTRPQRF